jgi:hypothetical protein
VKIKILEFLFVVFFFFVNAYNDVRHAHEYYIICMSLRELVCRRRDEFLKGCAIGAKRNSNNFIYLFSPHGILTKIQTIFQDILLSIIN